MVSILVVALCASSAAVFSLAACSVTSASSAVTLMLSPPALEMSLAILFVLSAVSHAVESIGWARPRRYSSWSWSYSVSRALRSLLAASPRLWPLR